MLTVMDGRRGGVTPADSSMMIIATKFDESKYPIIAYERLGDSFVWSSNPPGQFSTMRIQDVSISPDGAHFAFGITVAPFLKYYRLIGSVFTELTVPYYEGGDPVRIAFTPDSARMAVRTRSAPRLTMYDKSGDTLTHASISLSHSIGVGTPSKAISFSPDGEWMVIGLSSIIYLRTYSVSGNTYTVVALTGDALTTRPSDVFFSPDGTKLYVVLDSGSSQLAVYDVSESGFTRAAITAEIMYGTPAGAALSPDGTLLAVATNSETSGVDVRTVSGNTFTKWSVPSTARGLCAAFSASGDILAVGFDVSPFLRLYAVDKVAQTLTQLPDPDIMPTRAVTCITFTPV